MWCLYVAYRPRSLAGVLPWRISAELGAWICVTTDEPINQLTTDYPLCAVTHTHSHRRLHTHIPTNKVKATFRALQLNALCMLTSGMIAKVTSVSYLVRQNEKALQFFLNSLPQKLNFHIFTCVTVISQYDIRRSCQDLYLFDKTLEFSLSGFFSPLLCLESCLSLME